MDAPKDTLLRTPGSTPASNPRGKSTPPPWAKPLLRAAAVYNIVWGTLVIFAPNLFFRLAGMQLPNYPQLWQCVGMIVGVYGVGYWIAASDPRRHWPIVLVGMLGKVFGPIGFAKSLIDGSFPLAFGINIVFNDLLWWAPFAMLLWDAWRSADEPPASRQSDLDPLDALQDDVGRSVRTHSMDRPLLLVFLRHVGCTFCREALADLAKIQPKLASSGVSLAIVTMSDAARNRELAAEFGLDNAHWFSDPDRGVYRAMGLKRGGFMQLFGPSVWWPGLRATLRGHLVGRLEGDGFQMPGAFLVHRGSVRRQFRHAHAAERPDYEGLACELPA